METVQKNPLSKMMYLIRRREAVSREELIANWFANHMPDVIAAQHAQAEKGRPHAHRYIATLFDPPWQQKPEQAEMPTWDGVAQLWWDEPVPPSDQPHGTEPRDTFQQKAEPYLPWATTEYVVLDGSLPAEPNTLNEPYPFTRSRFVKVTALIVAKADVDFDEFHQHWLGLHASNVAGVMKQTGGYRYVISLSDRSEDETYAGMAELYFPDRAALARHRDLFKPDGMDQWVDRDRSQTLFSGTEMVGIP